MPTHSEIVQIRLRSQQIVGNELTQPEQVSARFGAMQAQDFTAVQWALGLRCRDGGLTAVEQAFATQKIVRTWLMRGTLQIAAAADVRWMLELLAPRLIANSGRRYQQLELSDSDFGRSFDALTQMLAGGQRRTRAEVLQGLDLAGISTQAQRGYHILRRAGLEGLICFGPMAGKEETFVLLDDGAQTQNRPERDESLAELARRYFQSHGPATLPDFVWWSGLKAAEARRALEMIKPELEEWKLEENSYWLTAADPTSIALTPTAHLLPAYDEYYLGYRDRSAVLEASKDAKKVSSSGVFRPIFLIDGRIRGTWKRRLRKNEAEVQILPFKPLSETDKERIASAVKRYSSFLAQSDRLLFV